MISEQSAVIVPVPEADAVVRPLRTELDRTAVWGVPAHVTVVYPFGAPSDLGPADLDRLRAAVASVPRFEVTFDEVRWFGDDVVWLAPRPDGGFRALLGAVVAAFPQYPPYGGAFGSSVPHLTIGAHGERARLRSAAAEVARRLPIRAAVTAAHLFQGSDAPGGWRGVAELPLGPRRSGPNPGA
ncbi:hypothetical protein AFB00_14785 [Pseudonocardia sp. HH130630-07]|nr:hypothetical protein AFB00_14785 [Pseudonocardia sp. HH130630-07]